MIEIQYGGKRNLIDESTVTHVDYEPIGDDPSRCFILVTFSDKSTLYFDGDAKDMDGIFAAFRTAMSRGKDIVRVKEKK